MRLLSWIISKLFGKKKEGVEVIGDFPDWYKDAVKESFETGKTVYAEAPEEQEDP